MSALTVKDVAERYGVAQHVTISWIKNGSLRAINVARHPAAKRPTWRVTEQALAEFELKREVNPPAPPTHRRKRAIAGRIERY